MDSAKRAISGTWGELWLDGEKVAECYGLQAKITYNKEEVAICGQPLVDTKVMSAKGTGSIKLHHVYSRMIELIGDSGANGRDRRFILISKLADPDAYGTERVALSNLSFDDLTIADWEAAKRGVRECPFTFADNPKWLDKIGAA